jgi:MFS transporter, FHS family, L-fucose permease
MASPQLTVRASTGGSHTGSASMVWAVIALFFIWGGLTSLNDILIPKLKALFSLSYTEAMLTQFAFFMAYFIVSLPAGHLIARIGYLKGILLGLSVMAAGCLLFVPASHSSVYATFLGALFVLAAGITILQVAANPMIANMGDPATASSRLTFAQAFNSLGTTIFPPVGAMIILSSMTDEAAGGTQAKVHNAQIIGQTYIGIALCLILVAGFFWWQRSKLPSKAEAATKLSQSFGLLKQPRLGGGVACIFLYVGAEVAIGSLLINFLMQKAIWDISSASAGRMIALYWGGAMIGRFIGAGALRLFAPGKVLMAVCFGAASLSLIAALASGPLAGWALLSVGLMNAVMFPTIFTLGVEGLGERTPEGSGLLCMAIVGGAIIPLAVGALADATTLAAALSIPAACYQLIALYGWMSRKPVVTEEV